MVCRGEAVRTNNLFDFFFLGHSIDIGGKKLSSGQSRNYISFLIQSSSITPIFLVINRIKFYFFNYPL